MDWQIHGHDWAVSLLHAHAAGDKLRHAYLFVGPEGVGRRTLALRFAQALNCSEPPAKGDFCGSCKNCCQIAAMAHPDLSLLKPEEGHKDILIEQVRALQHTLALAPYAARYRIALLPDFQHSTDEAKNALLKTLEEPPNKVIMLVTASSPESLLPTVVSRCEVVRLRPASLASVQALLQTSRGLTSEKAELIAHLSSGRVGAALRLADDPEAMSDRHAHLEEFLNLLPTNRVERFALAEKIARGSDASRQKASEVLPIWLSYWRDVFVRISGADLPLVNADLAAEIDRTCLWLDEATARALVIAHEKAIHQLDQYANVRLLLETLMLRWPQVYVRG